MRRAILTVGLLAGATAALAEEPASQPQPESARFAPAPPVELPPLDRRRARELYDAKCRTCHGSGGRGDGPAARWLDPPPRDFTRRAYKFRSTRTGKPPAPADLFATISAGLPGTAMPAWGGLTEADRWQLVLLVSDFAAWPARGEPEVLVVPEPTAATRAAVARGRAVYRRMECAKCHGDAGRGDGPAAGDQRDDRGRRILPFDLTRGASYRAGCGPEDVFTTLMTGVDGTPMPSYVDALPPADAWDLIHFLRSWFVDSPSCPPRR